MTDVMEEGLSWEQRREIRRKKRQELLAEADRVSTHTSETTASRVADEDDEFEQERQRRRRERDERRKREREELEKQLKEEEEARAEREKRREERRRQREEADLIISKSESKPTESSYYHSSSVIVTTKVVHHEDGEDEVEETITKEEESIEQNENDDFTHQNGDENQENGHAEEVVEYNEEMQEDDDGTRISKTTYSSVTVTTTRERSASESSSSSSSSAESVKEPEPEPAKSQTSSSRHSSVADEPAKNLDAKERRRLREERLKAEEEENKRIAEQRKIEHEKKLEAEKEERIRRRAEAQLKRNEALRKEKDLHGKERPYKSKRMTDDQKATTNRGSRPVPKNKSRRSLEAMEKQAGDLYNFLSVLEEKKSSSNLRELHTFLEEEETGGGEVATKQSSASLKEINRSESVKDRLKRLQSENTNGPTSNPRLQKAQSLNLGKEPVAMHTDGRKPKPPVRRDSMKRIEMLRSQSANLPQNPIAKVESRKPVIQKRNDRVSSSSSDEEVKFTDSDKPTRSKINRTPRVAAENEIKPDPKPNKPSNDVSERLKHRLNRRAKQESKPAVPEKTDVIINKASPTIRRRRERKIIQSSTHVENDAKSETTITVTETNKSSSQISNNSKTIEMQSYQVEQILLSDQLTEQHSDNISTHSEDTSSQPGMERLSKDEDDKPLKSPTAKVSNINSRLDAYTKVAAKEPKKTAVTPTATKAGGGVADRMKRWEQGRVGGSTKRSTDAGIVRARDIASRKNLWESGKVSSTPDKKAGTPKTDVGADLSSRKNMWLKVTQGEGGVKKTESPTIKTGVRNRLDKWEKGEVTSTAVVSKEKKASELPTSTLANKKNKWETVTSTSKAPVKKQTSISTITDVHDRKNMFENKAQNDPKPTRVQAEVKKPTRKVSISSESSSDDEKKEELLLDSDDNDKYEDELSSESDEE